MYIHDGGNLQLSLLLGVLTILLTRAFEFSMQAKPWISRIVSGSMFLCLEIRLGLNKGFSVK